jgi:hypothetical protein
VLVTGPQVDIRRRIFLGVFTSAAVLAVTYHPADFPREATTPNTVQLIQSEPMPEIVTTSTSAAYVAPSGTAPMPTPPAPPVAAEDDSAPDPRTADEYRQASDPGCWEDEAAIVAHDPDPSHGLTWICVPLDDL